MDDSTKALLADLRGKNSWDRESRDQEALALISRWGEADDLGRLRELDEILRTGEPGINPEMRQSLRHGVREALKSVEAIPRLETILAERKHGAELSPDLMTLLSEPHRAGRALALVDRHAGEPENAPMLLVLCHELSLRGIEGLDRPSVRALEARMRKEKHPLSWLPVARTELEGPEIEQKIFFGSYHSLGMPFAAVKAVTHELADAEPLERGAAAEITGADEARLIPAATADWVKNSNGKALAAVFRFSSIPDSPVSALKSLELECIDAQTLKVLEIGPATALASLFGAACNGGAYSHGRGVGWGRLDAWRSMAGLLGLPDDAPVGRVVDRAEQSSWFSLQSRSPWYLDLLDLTLAVLREGSADLAILAATDTD